MWLRLALNTLLALLIFSACSLFLLNSLIFKREYSFNNLRGANNGKLRFDFAIFKEGILKGLIEFQGEQHFYPVKAFGGIEAFQERKYND